MPGVAKVEYFGQTLIDISGDTVTAAHLESGYTAHNKAGDRITGTLTVTGGKNVQGYHGTQVVRSGSYVSSGVRLTVAKSGTYKVSWMGFKNTTLSNCGSRLYINGSGYGSNNESFTHTYGHSVVLNNVSLTAGQTIEVYACSRSSTYYMYVGNLLIEEI